VKFHQVDSPAFGTADLSNCELEQIHTPASIQPHGALLVIRASDHTIVQASENVAEFLTIDGDPIGRPLIEVDAALDAAAACEPIERSTRSVTCGKAGAGRTFDVSVHAVDGSLIVLELEPAHPPPDQSTFLERALQTVLSALTLQELADDTARLVKELTGYDRVMVYRFDQDGHGQVFAEQRNPDLEAFLGNRYPATDIPQIARRLYESNRVRVLVDIDYRPVPLRPAQPGTDRELDMSLCSLRSVSPIHIQYLKNMGVNATLVVSLMAAGTLWGLIACHHCRARNPSYEIRGVCEVIAEAVATRIAALEGFARAAAELAVTRIEKRMIEAIRNDGDWQSALFEHNQILMQPLNATGVALTYEGNVTSTGEVPGTQQVRAIAEWLDENVADELFETSALGDRIEDLAMVKPVASGIVAVPVSRSPGEYLMWFRPERIRTVTWGGNPNKPVEFGDHPKELSPRRSFAKWHQQVEGTSDHWSITDRATAQRIGELIESIVYQFRAVRMLIAEDQLGQVRRDVRQARQPVVVADPSGRLLLVNDAFYRLLPTVHLNLMTLEDLPNVFRQPRIVRELLEVMVRDRQPWRSEIEIQSAEGEIRAIKAEAEPVVVEGQRILGFVLHFIDVSDARSREKARRKFQEDVVSTHHDSEVPLTSETGLVYRNLLSNVVNNARIAALEITDGMDVERVPQMLASVFDSVIRTKRTLRDLLSRRSG
jgi:chemotaxis family two-component system sensor kinase Cph1